MVVISSKCVIHELIDVNRGRSCGSSVSTPAAERLCSLVSELSLAFKDARAEGGELNNRQDPCSFRGLDQRVRSLLEAYSKDNRGDWRQYAVWGDHSYLRHLLWSSNEFELMVLCWKEGQTSRVHNHADSHCWLAVLEGEVRETLYAPLRGREEEWRREAVLPEPAGAFAAAGGADAVSPRLLGTRDLQVGDVGYINDHIALHSVGCCARAASAAGGGEAGCEGSSGAPRGPALACTLHLYCPPIRRVKAFEQDGSVTECVPGFFSRHSLSPSDGCSIA